MRRNLVSPFDQKQPALSSGFEAERLMPAKSLPFPATDQSSISSHRGEKRRCFGEVAASHMRDHLGTGFVRLQLPVVLDPSTVVVQINWTRLIFAADRINQQENSGGFEVSGDLLKNCCLPSAER